MSTPVFTSPDIQAAFAAREADRRWESLTPLEKGQEAGVKEWTRLERSQREGKGTIPRHVLIFGACYPYGQSSRLATFGPTDWFKGYAAEFRRCRDEWAAQQPDATELAAFFAAEDAVAQ